MKKNVKKGALMSSWDDGAMKSSVVALQMAEERWLYSDETRERRFILSCGLICSIRNTFKQQQFDIKSRGVGIVPSLPSVCFYSCK